MKNKTRTKMKIKKDCCDDRDPDFVNEEKKPVKKRRIKTEPEFDLNMFVNLNEPTSALICLYCSEEFETHLDFGLHSKLHNDRKRYACHLCDFETESKTMFRNHLRGHDTYKCEKCERILKNKLSAYKHSKTHLAPNIVQCEICGKYLKKQCLYMHRRNLHSEGSQTYKCPICSKEYVHSSSLRQHYSSFHKELGIDLSVVCDICGMKLSCKAKLDQHHRTHTGEKPFACTICQKRCISRDVLLSHMRVHTGEKPFECKYCGKRFAHSAPYRYHIKTHTGEKSHMCPICGRGFISKANMRIHLKTCSQPHHE